MTTKEVAGLLKVHPKHVYRLLKRGLPAHRVGDEWRFDEGEVRHFCQNAASNRAAKDQTERRVLASVQIDPPAEPPSFVAANGDVAIEVLLDEVRRLLGPCLGHIPADHETGLGLLRRESILVSGFHGEETPTGFCATRMARIQLVEREVGLVFERGLRLRKVSSLVGRRFAGRPPTAGIRAHLDLSLQKEGVDPAQVYKDALLFDSHRDVVMAVVRGEAQIGLASQGWAARAGLGFLALASESYGLLLRARHLGHPSIVGLCEVAQGPSFRRRLASGTGYSSRRAGEIRLASEP